MHALTPRQLQILRFIRDFRAREGYSPSMQEMGDALGLTKVTVFEHVAALEKKGALLRGPKHSARSLQVSPDVQFADEKPTRLPLAGRIAAGSPIEAIEDQDTVDLEEMFTGPGDNFVLQVAGTSMIEDQIRDGDYVVCRKESIARNGQTVVALLDNGEATLKKFYKEKGRIRLQPANASLKPIYVDNVRIQGVVIGVIRRV
ncbi:MAG: LexA repressor [Planctomycetes bacterium ADurb.Bin126]|nr:MAG: LexA repressor [Planctomycetes bacterium ADurb.Bin126]HOD83431.1 transcriptional repressor LexA [Phycisphaerae bacterium]HQL76009.1 transcriptional repressor LexA [Phycisphaerae bacterium]